MDLAELKAYFDKEDPVFKSKSKLEARLLDEDDPDGTVIITDDKGNMRYMMPREVYDEICGGSGGQTRKAF